MQTRLIFPSLTAVSIPLRTLIVGNTGHVILESNSALLRLFLAWGQKPQFAVHLPVLWVIKYAVVGSASILPSTSPRIMAEPAETRIFPGGFLVRFSSACFEAFRALMDDVERFGVFRWNAELLKVMVLSAVGVVLLQPLI